MINKLKAYISRTLLNQQFDKIKRNKEIKNIDQAQSILIVYEACDEESFNLVSNFAEYLKSKKKYVQVLGYIPNKMSDRDYTMRLDYHLIRNTDVNWIYKPISPRIIDLVEKDFDILINLSISDYMVIANIVSYSKAKFKVGMESEINHKIHDMLINFEPKGSVKEFLRLVRYYMEMINKPTE